MLPDSSETRYFDIRRHDNGGLLYGAECASLGECVERAVAEGASLACADLREVDLHGVAVRSADFREADFTGSLLDNLYAPHADFSRATLKSASLRGARLNYGRFESTLCSYSTFVDADLSGSAFSTTSFCQSNLVAAQFDGSTIERCVFRLANMDDASFCCCKVRDTSMTNACITNADFQGAVFQRTTLNDAWTTPIRTALFDRLKRIDRQTASRLQESVSAGLLAISELDGISLTLCGTIAMLLQPDRSRLCWPVDLPVRPIERFVSGVRLGETAETNEFLSLTAQWIGEFITEHFPDA